MRLFVISCLKSLLKLFITADPRVEKVRELIRQADALHASNGNKVDGQRKRSWVLNNLITAFPDAKVKDLSFLIEHVIQEI